jgi:hypothetical protein
MLKDEASSTIASVLNAAAFVFIYLSACRGFQFTLPEFPSLSKYLITFHFTFAITLP